MVLTNTHNKESPTHVQKRNNLYKIIGNASTTKSEILKTRYKSRIKVEDEERIAKRRIKCVLKVEE